MKKLLFFCAFCFFLLLSNLVQSQYQRTIGGTLDDVLYSSVQTTDGGFIATGWTRSFGVDSANIYVVKISSSGTIQWSKTIGGANDDGAYGVIQSTDGGYVVAGYTRSFGAGDYDMLIIKLSSSGAVEWNKTIGAAGYDYARSVIQVADGGYIIDGATNSFGAGNFDYYFVKLSSSGSLEWSKTAGGTNIDRASFMIQTSDGGFAVTGRTNSFGAGNYDVCLIKFTSSYNIDWSNVIGGTDYEEANSIRQTTDGGYVIAGQTGSYGAGLYDMYILKVNSLGALQWSRTVGGTNNDYGNSIFQTTEGGYIVGGSVTSFGAGGQDMYIVKLTTSGTLDWSRTIGGTNNDLAYTVYQTSDGGYNVNGYTGSFGVGAYDLFNVKLNSSGNTCGNSTSPSSLSGSGGTVTTTTLTAVSQASSIATLTPAISSGGTVTTLCLVGIQQNVIESPDSYSLSQNHPNPFNPNTNIKFQVKSSGNIKLVVFDILGKEVVTLVNEKLAPGTYETTFDASAYPSGVYFYKLITDGFTENKKMTLIK
jgi:hypothetical protein